MIGVAVLALVLVIGLRRAADTPLDNFAPTFVFIIFWVGLVFASVLFGDVFRAFNPWRALGRVLFRGRTPRPYPERLGRWPAAVGLLDLHVDRARVGLGRGARHARHRGGRLQRPHARRRWRSTASSRGSRHGETFSVYFNLFSRLSVFETRDRVVGMRPLLGGLPRLDPVPGTVALVS